MAINSESTTQTTWQLDPIHTLVEFSGRHMMVSTVKGRFKSAKGTIVIDEADPSRSSVEVEIDATSLESGAEQRDGHLKSPDFLDIANFPVITFKSTRVEPVGSERARITGDLMIRGVTRPVVLDTELIGRNKTPWNTEVAGFEARTTISRKDFGLTWNMALETGGVLVADTVKIEIHAEANK